MSVVAENEDGAVRVDDILLPVTRDDLGRLIDSLKPQAPHSLKVIDIIFANTLSSEWKTMVYVDHLPRPSVVVCMNSRNDGPYTPVGDIDVFIHTTSPCALKQVLTESKVIDWTKTMVFEGLESTLQSVLEEAVPASASLKFDVFNAVDVYVHTDETKLQRSVPEGLSLNPLRKEDAETVMRNWKFGRDWMLPEMRHTIEKNSSSGLFSGDGELISWALHNFIGGIGFVHTLEKYRGQGYAKLVIADATRRVSEHGITPWAHVEDVPGRERSERMLEAVGYAPSGVRQVFGFYAPAGKEITF